MSTYNTYAEAKIANPECVAIYKNEDANEFSVSMKTGELTITPGRWELCNPADHCSTLAEFLDAGYELVDGDYYLANGNVRPIGRGGINVKDSNSPRSCDHSIHILSAVAIGGGSKIPENKVSEVTNIDFEFGRKIGATLYNPNAKLAIFYRESGVFEYYSNRWGKFRECKNNNKWRAENLKPIPPAQQKRTKESAAIETLERMGYVWKGGELWKPSVGIAPNYIKPKRTEVEYVKVIESIFDLKDEFERGDLYVFNGGNYTECKYDGDVATGFVHAKLFRCIETEISERDEFIERMRKFDGKILCARSSDEIWGCLFDDGLRFNK
ncbi:hypothetical protein NVP1052A_64 [Vibrio phage 1.052.A._10N.286.46.C3]|nr:hypothetical protein NVP1052A_64 [Vibrio phage 1.052.A._10N.286.46.C3]